MQNKNLFSPLPWKFKISALIVIIFIIIFPLIIFLFIPPIPQWNSYHQFADTHHILSIPNFWNVVSNIPFLIVSLIGFLSLDKQLKKKNLATKEAIVFFILFFGIFLIGIGSAYYHLSPNNSTLVWDRIPITMVFMSLLSLTLMERVNVNFGFWLLPILIMIGIFSVLYWHWTELLGRGDLRLYGLVQFYSILLIIIILYFFPKSYPPLKFYICMFVFYSLAKIFEEFDVFIYHSNGLVSGHTLKHIFAAISVYWTVPMLNYKNKS